MTHISARIQAINVSLRCMTSSGSSYRSKLGADTVTRSASESIHVHVDSSYNRLL